MKWSSHNCQANRECQTSDCQSTQDAEIDVCRSGCDRANNWRRMGILATCACLFFISLFFISAETVSAQERSKATAKTSSVSTKEQLVSRLQALRVASMERESVENPEEPEEPSELFLDLSNGTSSAIPETDSHPTMASNLGVSMSSSPTQVLMRAVAWIAIVLCVCCLGILGARRWQRERGLLPTVSSRSKVIETLSLGPSRTVSLIEMHGYRALVATDAGGIRSLVLAPSPFEDSLIHEEEVSLDP